MLYRWCWWRRRLECLEFLRAANLNVKSKKKKKKNRSPNTGRDNFAFNVGGGGIVNGSNSSVDWGSGGRNFMLRSPNLYHNYSAYCVLIDGTIDYHNRYLTWDSCGWASPRTYSDNGACCVNGSGNVNDYNYHVDIDSYGNKITFTELVRVLKFDKYKLTADFIFCSE